MAGMDPEKAALKSLMSDASAARLGPSRVAPDSGAAEVLRALGQQLMEQADALESGAEAEPEMGSGEYELDDEG
jgi:hypothetical protein